MCLILVVLNLIINGLPSKHAARGYKTNVSAEF